MGDRRRNSFDSLRLLFAILVIFSHSYPLTLGDNAREPLARIAATPLVPGDEVTFGAIAVWAFFVLSGFLITKSWLRSSTAWSYLRKRFRRIYPGFLVAVVFCVLVQAGFTDPGTQRFPGVWNVVWHSVRLQIFATPALFGSNPLPNIINGSLWSIPYEFWCYVGVLILGLAGLLKSRRWTVMLFVGVIAVHLWINYRRWLPVGSHLVGDTFGYPLNWMRILPFFLAGQFFAIAENRVELRPTYAVACAILVGLATPFPYLPHIIYPAFGSYLLLYLAFSPALLPLNLGRWGDFSYGTYLYAFPMQQLLIHLFQRRLTPFELFLMATPLAVGAGALSWFVVERRFLSRESERKHEQRVDAVVKPDLAP
jgi:peptidoglycan/LPS O-acetylase OafA/YrhL